MIARFDKLLSFAKEKNWKVERYKKLIGKETLL
jgi:putative polysaccharide deacetylase